MRKAAGIHSKRYSLFQERNTRRPSLNAKSLFVLDFALCILHFAFSTSFVPHFPPFVNPLRPFHQKFFKNRPNPLYKSPKICYTIRGQDHGTADALGEVVTNRIPLLPARPYAVRHHRGGLIFCPRTPCPEAGRRYII